ncbi:MgtC/SapB family protein [bacterium]
MYLTALDTALRLVLAAVLGGVLGMEREKQKRSAGLRTHILVCLGSTLIMLVSIYVFQIFTKGETADPSRIAASVVTGIGFLGAGAIIRSRENVIGLTTAASIWVSAGIGLAVGCGFYIGAFMATLIAFLTLGILKNVENSRSK